MNTMTTDTGNSRRACLQFGAAACLTAIAPWSLAPVQAKKPLQPPTEVLSYLPQAVYRGSGRLSFFGLHVYDARLWVDDSFFAATYAQHPMALELEYARRLEGKLIAERSLAEIRKLSAVADAKAQAWLNELLPLFPDVAAGDRITGIQRPGQPSRFYVNGQARGEIQDAELTLAFFSIWFSPRTTEPKLRLALLKPQAQP